MDKKAVDKTKARAKAALAKAKEAIKQADFALDTKTPRVHTVETMHGTKVVVKEVAPDVFATDVIGHWGKPSDSVKLKMYEHADAILTVKEAKKAKAKSLAQSERASKPRTKRAAPSTVAKREWKSIDAALIKKTVQKYIADGHSVIDAKELAAGELKCSFSQVSSKYKK